MYQLCWNPSSKIAEVLELPSPSLAPGQVLVRNAFSVISAGTEKSNTELSLSHPIRLMRSRPDLVLKVRRMARAQGLWRTWEAVKNRVGGLQAVGYSCAGWVEAVGDQDAPFQVGDAVSCMGAGYAVHASEVVVPYNLCASVPAECDMATAALGALGAIALQGIRLARAAVGERVLVIGLGLIGQLTVRLALAAGCQVAVIDPDAYRTALAAAQGATPAWSPAQAPPQGDFDAVLITAAAATAEPLALAGRLARPRGRVVAVGLFPLELPRDLFYQKELEFVVSRSTGPGRYDPNYEELGLDYPAQYVRWTQNRNLSCFLELASRGKLGGQNLITHRFPIAEGAQAYAQLAAPKPQQLGLLLEYPAAEAAPSRSRVAIATAAAPPRANLQLACIGAGQFARAVLLPALAKLPVGKSVICTRRPLEGRSAGTRFGFAAQVSDPEAVFLDSDVQAVVIATRHDSHGPLVLRGLQSGKAVFVEKPLAIRPSEVAQIAQVMAAAPRARLMVGFNRRFAPLSPAVRRHFAGLEEHLTIHYRVNAGYLPPTDWTQILEIGGGRVVGEVCHFVDWIAYLTNSQPATVQATSNRHTACGDDLAITMVMQNGAVGTITYVASGSPAMPKERIEAFAAGKSAIVEDWRTAQLASGGRIRSLRRPGKGHEEEIATWVEAVKSGAPMPIDAASLITTTTATFAVAESLRQGAAVAVKLPSNAADLAAVCPA